MDTDTIVGEAFAEALTERGGSMVAADDPYFLPFVYGTMLNPAIGGTFAGLGSWHDSVDLLRSALEGVVFTHRYHLQALTGVGPIDTRPVRLAGGGSRSAGWTQLFADATGLTLELTDAIEPGARGAAMLAGVGVGVYADVDEAAAACVTVTRTSRPRLDRKPLLDSRYDQWIRTATALQTVSGQSREHHLPVMGGS